MNRSSYVVIFLVAIMLLGSCGGEAPSGLYKGPFYTLTLRPFWKHFDYVGDMRKEANAYFYTVFSKSPIEIKKTYGEDDFEYGIICASYFDTKVKQGDFKQVQTIPTNAGSLKFEKNEQTFVSGLNALWQEVINTGVSLPMFNLWLTVPLDSGYIYISCWCPQSDIDLIEEFKQIAKTLYIKDPQYLVKNPVDESWRTP